MTPFEIVLIVLAVFLVVFIGGGMLVAARRARRTHAHLTEKIAAADKALATANAGDRGWDATQMEAAALASWSSGAERVAEAHLVQVVDLPGTDADEAVYRLVGASGTQRDVRIRRTGSAWSS